MHVAFKRPQTSLQHFELSTVRHSAYVVLMHLRNLSRRLVAPSDTSAMGRVGTFSTGRRHQAPVSALYQRHNLTPSPFQPARTLKMSQAALSRPDQEKRCSLMGLPPELRELIHGWTFWVPDGDGEVELARAHAPDKALLLACETIYHEARTIYRRAHQDFWTESKFCLDLAEMSPLTTEVTMNKAFQNHGQDILHMTSLRVIVPSRTRSVLIHKNGGWKASLPDGRTQYLRVRPWITRGERHLTRLAWDGHGDERSLVEACEQYGSLPLVDQILRLPSLQI